MSGNARNSRWSGFLPTRAIVMARATVSTGAQAGATSGASTAAPLDAPPNPHEAHASPSSPELRPLPAPASLLSSPNTGLHAPAPELSRPAISRFELSPSQLSRADLLAQVAADLDGCPRCKLCTTRKTIVVGEGDPHAELVFVGEGPGEQEDLEGRPFVGRSGELLDKMIEAMGLHRNRVYILNVVKCRPPGNRNPEPDEIAACAPFLQRQLDILQPKVIVALGKFAAQTLLRTDAPISRLRGQFKPYGPAKLMPTFHPAYLLRSPESKREAWADLQAVARELGLSIPAKKG